MTRILGALLLLTALPVGVGGQVLEDRSAGGSAFLPDTILTAPGGPRVVVLETPGEGVAALRLSVPFRESPMEAGAGQILRDMALHRMETLARPVGVRVGVSRTPWGLAYAVEGAAADFEYMAYLLRQAVAEPDLRGPEFSEARVRLQAAAGGGQETPGGLLLSRLRSGISRGSPSLQGSPASAAAMDAGRVVGLWRRTHQASAMTLVTSAPVVPEVILAATRGIGAPESARGGPPDAPARAAPRSGAETLRTHFGEAFAGGGVGDPHAQVAALLVARSLAEPAVPFELGVQLWELADQWVLAVTGAAYSRDAAAMRRAVSGALTRTRTALDADAVARAVAQLRRDEMLRARTPGGLVAVVGRAAEAGGEPEAAARSLQALSAVDATSLRAYLDRLIRGGPVRAEVTP